MKLYLFLSITLPLAYEGFGKNIEKLNTENTSNLVKSTVTPKTKNVLNSTANAEMLTTENTLSSQENASMPITKNTSEPTTNTETSTKNFFDWEDDASVKNIPEPNCTENMRPLYWIAEENIWKCICIQPFFSTPMNNTCVKLFRQGPCEPGNFVIRPRTSRNKSAGPRCAPNPCLEDELVPYNGTCHNITINSVCNNGQQHFNETSSEIGCKYVVARPRKVIEVPARRKCPSDSRIDKNGRCRRKL